MSVTRYGLVASLFLALLGLAVFFSSRASTTFASAHQAPQALLASDPTNQTIPTTGGGPFGVAVDAANGQVLVTADYSNTVDVISTSTLSVTKQVPVGLKPYYIVPGPEANSFLVGNTESNTVSVFDSTSDTVTGIWGPYTTTTNSSLYGIAIKSGATPALTRVYLADNGGNAIYAVDGNGILKATLTDPSFNGPYGIAYDPTANAVYVSNVFTNTVSVIDASTGILTTTITVGANPRAIVYDAMNDRVYVANGGDRNPALPNGNTVSVIDPTTNTVVTNIPVGNAPKQLALDAANNRLYVTAYSQGVLYPIDTTNNTVVGTGIPVGNNPLGVDIDSGANVAYVANTLDNTISVVNFSLMTQTPTATVTTAPTDTATPAVTNTPIATASPTNTPTVTSSPSATSSPTSTSTVTVTPTATTTTSPETPTPTMSSTVTSTPDATPPSTTGQIEPRIYLPFVGN